MRHDESVPVLVFELDDRRFGLLSEVVLFLCQNVTTTLLPDAPRSVEGIIDFHGDLVPVLDVRARLGLALRRASRHDHLILARARHRTVALRVDRAVDLLDVDKDGIQPVVTLVNGGELATGVARAPDGLVVICDLDAFLDEAAEATLSRALAALEAS